MHINDLERATIEARRGWEVTYHELYNLSPEVANAIEGCPDGFSIWHSHFSQDLLQMKNGEKGLLLDVGWYPHSDPSGSFGLALIGFTPADEPGQEEEYHWDRPLLEYQSRDLASLLDKISQIVKQ